jgi:hypothetical protein
MSAWQQLLRDRGLPAECVWIFDENLCLEADAARPDGYKLGFQLTLTPPPSDAERITYDYFLSFDAPLVFYRIGSSGGKSVCLMLCDAWFKSKGEAEGYLRRDDWLMAYHPGGPGEVEEVTDAARWKSRVLKNRPLHDLDFCMRLQSVHELLAHGRVLTAYEHYALRFLHVWTRFLPHQK